jgi:anti-sigma-K factor RskA
MNPNHHIEPAHDCDAIQDLIPEYAFGMTDAEETRLVEANLASCPEAATQLVEFQTLQEEMRAGVPQVEPSPQLFQRLMNAITEPATVPAAPSISAAPVIESPKPAPLAQPTTPKRSIQMQPAWLAAAAALIALVITNVFWFSRVDDLSRRHDELVALVRGQENNAFVLTSTSDLRWVRLPPSQEDAPSMAFMMWNAESEIGLLYARGFPELTTGKTYQLWLTRGEERKSAGTFRIDADGNGALLFHANEPIDEYTWARITEEPESGSDQPTGTVVVHGEL